MKRLVRAAAAQLSPVLNDKQGTTDKVVGAIHEAAKSKTQLIVFPETFIPNYPYFSFVYPPVQMGKDHLKLYEQAVTIPDECTAQIGEAAAETNMVVVLGVNERDHGTLYNAQIIFDSKGEIVLKRRKITPTYHERMVWGQGDGSGLKAVNTSIARLGALACWEHYNPLARFALIADHEEIHCSQFPGSMVGQIFGDQIEVTIRHHALESGCFVINSTGWLTDEQKHEILPDVSMHKALSKGCMTTIISPEGKHLCEPLTEGEGIVYADLDMSLITKRKRMMDAAGHYSRPELLSLIANREEQLLVKPVEKHEIKKEELKYSK